MTITDSPAILTLQQVSKTFLVKPIFGPTREVQALRDISLNLQSGRALALVGESGSGKSTVGRLILRQFAPSSGRILFDGYDIAIDDSAASDRAYRRAIQMVFQDPFSSLNPAHTIRHHLIRPLRLHQAHEDYEAAMRQLLTEVDLDPETTAAKYPHELSGGQRQRVNFARALAVNARLIVADEPTSMLDVSIRRSILGLMRRLKKDRGLTLLYITHDLATARDMAEDTAVMFQGQIVEAGPTETVISHPGHDYTRLLLEAVPDPAIRLTGATDGFAERVAAVRAVAAAPVLERRNIAPGHWIARHQGTAAYA